MSAGGGGRKLRILCLHGYRQSRDAFRAKTGSFRKGVKKFAEFVMFDAPHRIDEDAPEDAENANERGWYFCHDHHYHSTEPTSSYVGFDESVARVREVIAEEGPFDGMLAFSQGAQFLAILCAKAQQARARGEIPEVDPKFAVFVSGFPSYAKDHEGLFVAASSSEASEQGMTATEGSDSTPSLPPSLPPIEIPSLHIMGTTDQVIPVALSEQLAARFADPVVVVHEGGHFVPWPKANTPQREAIRSFFTARKQEASDAEP